MAAPIELANLDDIVHDYQAGVSLNQLAKQAGVARDVLYRLFRREGVALRDRSEAETLKWREIRKDRSAVERQLAAAWTARDRADEHLERRVVSLYRAGTPSKRAVARQTGAKAANVGRILQKAGLVANRVRERRATGNIAAHTKATVSPAELPFADELVRRGLPFIHQAAIGARNLDFAFPAEGVAVEIVRRHWRDAKSLKRERLEEVIGANWRLFVIYDPDQAGICDAQCADELVTFLERMRREPATPGQYGVIGGHGEPVPETRLKLHHWSRVPGF